MSLITGALLHPVEWRGFKKPLIDIKLLDYLQPGSRRTRVGEPTLEATSDANLRVALSTRRSAEFVKHQHETGDVTAPQVLQHFMGNASDLDVFCLVMKVSTIRAGGTRRSGDLILT